MPISLSVHTNPMTTLNFNANPMVGYSQQTKLSSSPDTFSRVHQPNIRFGQQAALVTDHEAFNLLKNGQFKEFGEQHVLRLTALDRAGDQTSPTFDFSGFNMQELTTDLSNMDLRRVNMTGAQLQGASLEDTNLSGAILAGANLQGAQLPGADLTDANLQGADLSSANLVKAVLDGTNLKNTTLNNVSLSGAVMTGCQMQGSKGLTSSQQQQARSDGATI